MRRAGAVLALVALAAAGCGSGDDQPAAPSEVRVSGALRAGVHRLVAFEPSVQLEVADDGWYAAQPMATFIALNRYPARENDYVIVFRPAAVFEPNTLNTAAAPPQLSQWLHDHPGFTASAVESVTVGGRTADRLDVEVSGPAEQVIAPVPSNENYRFTTGDRVRFWIIDVDGPVIVSASAPAEGFDAFLPRAERVVSSLRFG